MAGLSPAGGSMSWSGGARQRAGTLEFSAGLSLPNCDLRLVISLASVSFTFLKEDVGQKLDLQASQTPAFGVAALGPTPGAALGPASPPPPQGNAASAQMAS